MNLKTQVSSRRAISRRALFGFTVFSLIAVPIVDANAQEPDKAKPKTKSVVSQSDWAGPAIWPSAEKLEKLLKRWEKQHPEKMSLERLGLSVEGRPIYSVSLTAPDTPSEDKERVLVTALHAGLERGAATTVMAIVEWLLSDDPAAKEILRRQLIVCLPLPDPDRYTKGEVSPLFGVEWTPDGHRRGGALPEASYVQRLMDQLQPEVHADIHGANLGFTKYISFDSSRGPNPGLYPYHRDIVRQMDAAAEAAGFPSDSSEDDAERMLSSRFLTNMRDKCWRGIPRFNAGTYAYYHYHTLTTAAEVFWERSGVVRHRRLLEIGNECWPGEFYRGYPTRVVMGNMFARVTAYGTTATARRRSRVELWSRMNEFTFGTLDPAVEGRMLCVFATSPAAEAKYLASPKLKDFLNAVKTSESVDAQPILKLCDGWPAGQNHTEAWFTLQRRGRDRGVGELALTDDGRQKTRPIEHGLSLRLRLPYGQPKVRELFLNGRPMKPSETDGFTEWTARSSRYIQINIPPERLVQDDFFVVTCDYDPGEQRKHWDTWREVE